MLTENSSSNALKYESENPVVRWLLKRFMNQLHEYVHEMEPDSVLDLGCGEGFTAVHLANRHENLQYHGKDKSRSAIAAARLRYPAGYFEEVDFLARSIDTAADLVLCLEVLEHLPDPDTALRVIAGLPARNAIISVPWEPFFRLGNLARGNHWKHFGNHPEHIQQFTPRSLERTLRPFFSTVRVETCFPWIFAVCRK